MAMAFGVYDAKDSSVMIDGVYITGFSEDMLSIEKDEDLFETEVGAQGDVVKNIVNDPLGTTTIKVQATSPQAGYLLSLAKRREPFPLWYINKNMGEKMGGTMANLIKYPTVERQKTATEWEFTFKIFDLVMEKA